MIYRFCIEQEADSEDKARIALYRKIVREGGFDFDLEGIEESEPPEPEEADERLTEPPGGWRCECGAPWDAETGGYRCAR